MADQAKRAVARFLIVLALAIGVAAGLLWQSADSEAEKNPYSSAFGLSDPPAADHTPSIVLLGLSGMGLLVGVILLSSAKPAGPKPGTRDVDAGWG